MTESEIIHYKPLPEISAVADCMAGWFIFQHSYNAALAAGDTNQAHQATNKVLQAKDRLRTSLQVAQLTTQSDAGTIISHAAWAMGLHPHMDPVDFRLAPIRHLTRRRVQKARLADQEPTNTRILLNLAQQTRQLNHQLDNLQDRIANLSTPHQT